jgi:hypothetical protein
MSVHRFWCRVAHSSFYGFGWAAVQICRRCGERWEHPALDGPVLPVSTTCSVRLVDAPANAKAKVRRMA